MFAGCIELPIPSSDDECQKACSTSSLDGRDYIPETLIEIAESDRALAGIPYDDKATESNLSERTQHPNRALTAFVQQWQWNTTKNKKEMAIFKDETTGIQILSWSRIDSWSRVNNSLEFNHQIFDISETDMSTTEQILRAYLKWGESLTEYLVGDFAFSIWDPRENKLLLARDQLGVRPLYYFHNTESSQLLFATSMSVVKDVFSRLKKDLPSSKEWLTNYIADNSDDWLKTPFEGLFKVKPAHILVFKNNQIQQSRYFKFDGKSHQLFDKNSDYVEHYKKLLEQAVQCRLESNAPVAMELSGGLDSSSIVAMAASIHSKSPQKYLNSQLIALGFSNHEQEPKAIQAILDSVQLKNTHIFTNFKLDKNRANENEQVFQSVFGAPPEHDIALVHSPVYTEAQKNQTRVLLSGFGGDEFVTTNATYALIEHWQNGELKKWLGSFTGNLLGRLLRGMRWLSHYFFRKGLSPNDQRIIKAIKIRLKLLPLNAITPFKQLNKNPRKESTKSAIGYLNYTLLSHQLSPKLTTRLENCTLMAARHGLEYRWPLLDIRLINFFLSVPTEQKYFSGTTSKDETETAQIRKQGSPVGLGRFLHRRAIAKYLPDEIVWHKKSMGKPLDDTNKRTNTETQKDIFIEKIKGLKIEKIAPELSELINQKAYTKLLNSLSKKSSSHTGNSLKFQTIDRIQRLNHWLNKNREGQ